MQMGNIITTCLEICKMTGLNVDYKYSLHKAKHSAYWERDGNKGTIVFNLPNMYLESIKDSPYWNGSDDEDFILYNFIKDLVYTDICERVCLERSYQGLKMKGNKCKPECCVRNVAIQLANMHKIWR
jgi:hypothetical protein